MTMIQRFIFAFVAAFAIGSSIANAAVQAPIAVTTYHYDDLRTGWNSERDGVDARKRQFDAIRRPELRRSWTSRSTRNR